MRRVTVLGQGPLADKLRAFAEDFEDSGKIVLDARDAPTRGELDSALDGADAVILVADSEDVAKDALAAGYDEVVEAEGIGSDRIQRAVRRARLRRSQSLLRSLHEGETEASATQHLHVINVLPDATIIVDALGIVRFYNPASEKLFGLEYGELLGTPFGVPAVEASALVDIVGAPPRVAEMRQAPLTWRGEPATLVTFRDVTAREAHGASLAAAEQAARRSNEELNQFARIISHDLKAPMRTVSSFCTMIAEDYKGRELDDTGLEWLQLVIDASGRMKDMINDLLAYSRLPDANEDEDTALNDVLDDLRAVLRADIETAGATLDTDDLPRVRASAALMRHLFQNLIGNALKFHGDTPPLINVRVAAREGSFARITVEDNGIGIDRRYLSQIFDVFTRLHTSDEYEGTGVGLAICKKIVGRLGGSIEARSTPGAGSAFTFTLPLA